MKSSELKETYFASLKKVTVSTLEGYQLLSMEAIKNHGNHDGQGSGTKEGWFLVNGEKLFVRKHWSNDGAGLSANENLTPYLGQIIEVDNELYLDEEFKGKGAN